MPRRKVGFLRFLRLGVWEGEEEEVEGEEERMKTPTPTRTWGGWGGILLGFLLVFSLLRWGLGWLFAVGEGCCYDI